MKTSKFKMTELGPIPEDWVVKRLGDLFELSAAGDLQTECSSRIKTNINIHPIYSNGLEDAGLYGYTSKPRYRADSITITGRGTLGHAEYRTLDFDAIIRLIVMRPSKRLDGRYVAFQINYSNPFHFEITSIPQLTVPQVSQALILLPPLAEQRRIAGALSDVDELIFALGKLIEKKRNIKTGAMQELLTGKTRLPGFKGNWVERPFCEFISRFATGLNPRQNFKLNSGGNNYYITIKDFKNGKISFNGCDKIDDLALRLINERSDLRAGDLLFSSIGRVGDAYVIKDTPANWNINESVFSLRPDESQMDVNFLYYLVKSNAVQERLTSGITGSTLTGIKIGELRGIVCFYPSDVVEQKAIAAVLSDMDAEIASLEVDRAKYERIKSGMMQELLTGKTRLV